MKTRREELFCCDDFARLDNKLSAILATPGHDDISVRFTGFASKEELKNTHLSPDRWFVSKTPMAYLNDVIVQDWQPKDSSFRSFTINENYFPVSGWFVLSYIQYDEV